MVEKKITVRYERKLTEQKRSSIQLKTQPLFFKRFEIEFSSSREVDNEMHNSQKASEPETGTKPPGQIHKKNE